MGRRGYDTTGLKQAFQHHAALDGQKKRIQAAREKLLEDENKLRETQLRFLVEMRNRLLSFSEIKWRGGFAEDEATLQAWHDQHAGLGAGGSGTSPWAWGSDNDLTPVPDAGTPLPHVCEWQQIYADEALQQPYDQEPPFSEDLQVGLMQEARARRDASAEELRKAQESYLVQARRGGMSFQVIQSNGGFQECESTLQTWYQQATSPSPG